MNSKAIKKYKEIKLIKIETKTNRTNFNDKTKEEI